MIYLLVGYMWLFIHRPFEVWPWLSPYHVERIYMLVTILCWMLTSKVWTSSRLNVGVSFLAASILVSALVSPYEGLESVAVENWFKLAVFYVILMTTVRNVADLKVLVVAFVVIMGLYELHSFREYLNGRGEYRMGTWRMIAVDTSLSDPNSFAASIIYGLPLLSPVYVLAKTKWQRQLIFVLIILGIICILLTGSRTGFVALALASLGAAMMSRFRWRILAMLVVIVPLIWNNLSEDLRDRYLTMIDPSRGPLNARESADSRERYFFMALEIWKKDPLFGVGPLGFSRASGSGQQAHTLYGEVLSELGTFGAVALIVLISGFVRNYRIARKLRQIGHRGETETFCYLTVRATLASVLLLLFLGIGGHNLFRFTWLWYAAFSALALRFLQEETAMYNCGNAGEWSAGISAESNWNAWAKPQVAIAQT